MIRMTDKEGDARFSLPVVHLSFLRSFVVRLFGCVTHTHVLVRTQKHADASKTQKQRYNISSLDARVHVCMCLCARQGTRHI